MAGWLIAHTGNYSRPQRRAITIMALFPDIDGIFVFGPQSWHEWHRTFGHNIFVGIAVPLITLLFFRKGHRLRLLPILYAAMFSHFLLDIFVTGWWILMPFWPISHWGILMSLYIPEYVMKYYIQIGLFVIFLVPTIRLIVKYHRTPLEVLGKDFDEFVQRFVTLPFKKRCAFCGARAFYLCDICGAPLCGRHRSFIGAFRVSCRGEHHALHESD